MSKKKHEAPATSATTEVYVHIYGTPAEDELQELNKGRTGIGNHATVTFGVGVTLHRAKAGAEACRKKTGGVVVKVKASELKNMFPNICLGISPMTPANAKDHFFQSHPQEHLHVNAVVPYTYVDLGVEGAEMKDLSPEDSEWLGSVADVIGWAGL